jgi:hypothetical protein
MGDKPWNVTQLSPKTLQKFLAEKFAAVTPGDSGGFSATGDCLQPVSGFARKGPLYP